MAEAPCNDLDLPLPERIVADLTRPPHDRIRPDEVARARQHAAARAFDEPPVVQEIAAQILLFSRS